MKPILTGLLLTTLLNLRAQQIIPENFPVYKGSDLGLTYSPKKSSFRIWAPTADNAQLLVYESGSSGKEFMIVQMKRSAKGTWTGTLTGDNKGKFYAFRVHINGKWLNPVPDPYAKAVGENGKRGMIIDLRTTDPVGWESDRSPEFTSVKGNGNTDAIIYELHVRDASIAANSGIKAKGKFTGLTERGTTNPEGQSTGLDHLKELGVTHVHLLPSYDFYSVDESKPATAQYNWGYDPLNYNTPEGSYATNAADGAVRIKEFKELVKAFHESGLRVVMDVVYNHTMLTEDSYFNQLVPGYYYRQDANGKFSNASACNNETASERPMMRKFIVESVKYWVREFHIDGFRFDLMGIHDIETMNEVSKELHKLKPDILIYGEGWTAGTSPLPDSVRALKANASKLDRVAVFSDDLRDGIKGSVFNHEEKGFASGQPGLEQTIRFGVAASVRHPQVDFSKVNYSKAPYATNPGQTISYAECHDNHVLWDKLAISCKGVREEVRREMHKLALSMVLTSQGVAFLHAGTEFLRTKKGNENSYNAGDSINAIDWMLKTQNADVYHYVKGLIDLRKKHPAFRMKTAALIAGNLKFLEGLPSGIVAYTINGAAVEDTWKDIFVVYNGTGADQELALPAGEWRVAVSNNILSDTRSGERFAPFSCSIFYRE